MNNTIPINVKTIESLLRQSFNNPDLREAIQQATGWDVTMFSKVQSGHSGITLEKIDAVCRALKLSVVPVDYMDWLAKGNEIGSNCLCARQSLGHCGRHR